MRVLSLILILIGGLILGYRGFESRFQVAGQEADQRQMVEGWRHLPPVMGGIALVSGLLLLASSGRREDN